MSDNTKARQLTPFQMIAMLLLVNDLCSMTGRIKIFEGKEHVGYEIYPHLGDVLQLSERTILRGAGGFGPRKVAPFKRLVRALTGFELGAQLDLRTLYAFEQAKIALDCGVPAEEAWPDWYCHPGQDHTVSILLSGAAHSSIVGTASPWLAAMIKVMGLKVSYGNWLGKLERLVQLAEGNLCLVRPTHGTQMLGDPHWREFSDACKQMPNVLPFYDKGIVVDANHVETDEDIRTRAVHNLFAKHPQGE